MWSKALKQYGTNTGKFNIPKRGTVEHAAVMVIMNELKKDKIDNLNNVETENVNIIDKNISKKNNKKVLNKIVPVSIGLDMVPSDNITNVIKEDDIKPKRGRKKAIISDEILESKTI